MWCCHAGMVVPEHLRTLMFHIKLCGLTYHVHLGVGWQSGRWKTIALPRSICIKASFLRINTGTVLEDVASIHLKGPFTEHFRYGTMVTDPYNHPEIEFRRAVVCEQEGNHLAVGLF